MRAGSHVYNSLFLSAPCKGFSGLLSETASKAAKYQALNGLTLRGIEKLLEAYADDPVELIIFENVPRIATRGRALLDEIIAILRRAGYVVAETAHDCGELGNLAQSRKRFLLVARHKEKIPPFLHEPIKHSLRGVGEVLDLLPLPLSGLGGAMHRMPSLQWQTWVRLAFVVAGEDWRSLNDLTVSDGFLRDYGIMPDSGFHGLYGVRRWEDAAGTVTSNGRPASGPHSVADPRPPQGWHGGKYRVTKTAEAAGTVIAASTTGNGAFAIADPRGPEVRAEFQQYGVRQWVDHSGVISGQMQPGGGPHSIADPRLSGAGAVADPRPGFTRGGREEYVTGGHYGVVRFDQPTPRAVTGAGQHDNGFNSVADPRIDGSKREKNTLKSSSAHAPDKSENSAGYQNHDNLQIEINACLPMPRDRLICIIIARDGTWHRPFTTLELAALQGLVDPAEQFELDGLSDAAWRERIGNCVPPPSAEAIAGVMGKTLLLAWAGESFRLSSTPIWVRNVAVGLSVQPQQEMRSRLYGARLDGDWHPAILFKNRAPRRFSGAEKA